MRSVLCFAYVVVFFADGTSLARAQLRALDVAAGFHHVCSRMSDGTVRCWGLNEGGQLGDGTTQNGAPRVVRGVRDAVALALGDRHSCALSALGQVTCWGDGGSGQLGTRAEGRGSIRPIPDLTATAIAAGSNHTCALTTAGRVACWGDSYGWELAELSGLDHVTALSALGALTCAVHRSGELSCWAREDPHYPSSPARVFGLEAVRAVRLGIGHSYTEHRNGDVREWEGLTFAMRDGGIWARWVAEGARREGPFVRIAVRLPRVACGLRSDGTTRCWRDPAPLSADDETSVCFDDGNDRPRRCEAGAPASERGVGEMLGILPSLSGELHQCSFSETRRETACWPATPLLRYQWGFETESRHRAVVLPLRSVTIAAGANHACALDERGAVSCWGSNVFGALGTREPCRGVSPVAAWQFDETFHGTSTDPQFCPAPMPVGGPGSHIGTVTHLAASADVTCARNEGGEVFCWGRGQYGGIGDGQTTDRFEPVRVRF